MGLIHVPKHFLGLSRPVGFIHNWKHAKKKVLVDLLPGPSQGLCFLLIKVLDGIKVWWQVKVAVILLILSLSMKTSMKISMTIYDYHHYLSLSITIYQTCPPLTVSRKTPQPVGDPSLMTFSILLLSFKIMSLLDRSSLQECTQWSLVMMNHWIFRVPVQTYRNWSCRSVTG